VLGLNIEQLSKVETLYKAKLDPELKKQVKDKYPHLLKKPNLKNKSEGDRVALHIILLI
jgi:hypothetical protein